MADSQRKLVLAIIEFLQDSIANKTVASASIESLEVAIDCIGDAFGVDHTDDQVKQQLSIKPASLRTVFDVYLKTQERLASTTAAPQPGMSMTLTEEQKAKAEELKAAGNKALGAQSYDEAIKLYTQAIEINPNHIYYANR
ncbi:Small glutamine-rich tetratricopeptide repeat-containing protein 2 [Tieghemiomyces parasiticus]|uniref:Small glutamine-rich tetratricopeptide repeat-containing protein 2 n=1 Tax=Tieghemiomyces parasiticus TaxID=78921 RepID=A0A9W8DNJ2_9FUNG|nr:Small glutamine-rich tetratricopeptide repeat-containing protein 2 [Tieghemiomyces parasiticus]